ncbi:MAG: hypothetical protein COU35_02385 [Candidatus Magasanikbacteria bacterium CG10_big_fil_rev_8_21_14_0_10_47_10]|uniref:CDP-diacylglycerol--glycerol-3-phosphate 3-phosphatidyltransferase n=1 Tax=Candidatus Magasanikbacteria bacterium CG10_big_fil_rev_8_21_14_0_10_47_10 TaxID=1974652 RepID=A0A2H0TQG7_9BACT|nr:MAG: hypothetical protein COU35_02385 [Candidatus Magasanikbacteria bacterium CG10_big_fil_rev_8_21_14_0_10_47_10]
MKITTDFVQKHPDLFRFQRAEHVFPHDKFLDKFFIQYISKRVTPNQVTGLRFFLTPFVVYIISVGAYIPGIVLFLFAAFTDALDGSLARTRNKITKFGMIIDPLADKLLVGSVVLLVVLQNFHILLGIAVLGIEIIFILTAMIAKIRFNTIRAANRWGKIKMILQVLAVFITLLALVIQSPALMTYAAWAFGLAIGFAIMSLFSHGL